MTRKLAATLLAVSLLAVSPTRAETVDRAAAKEAYDRGAKAFGRGDYQTAANEFATADALAPSPTALQAALDAAVEADAPAIGAELLERSKREKQPRPALAASIDAARKKFAGRGGFVHVVCPGKSCNATLDGGPIDPSKPTWAAIGPHTVALDVDGIPRPAFEIDVKPDTTIDVTPPANEPVAEEPLPPPPPRPAPSAKLDPIYFWSGAGATAALTVVTVLFGAGAASQHDEFVNAGCTNRRGTTAVCNAKRDDGQAAETRTNVALAATLVVGAATAVVGIFFTRWGQGSRSAASRPGVVISF